MYLVLLIVCSILYAIVYRRYKYYYRAGAFSGVRSYSGVTTGGTRNCGVFACTGETKDTCGTRFATYEENTTAIFEELIIVATMPTPVVDVALDADNFVVFPVSLQVSILPLETKDYTYSYITTGDVTEHTLILNNSTVELYTFALWSRRYATDGQEADPPVEDTSSASKLNSCLFTFILALVSFVFNKF